MARLLRPHQRNHTLSPRRNHAGPDRDRRRSPSTYRSTTLRELEAGLTDGLAFAAALTLLVVAGCRGAAAAAASPAPGHLTGGDVGGTRGDDRGQAGGGQRRPAQVETPTGRVPRFRDQYPAGEQADHHDRDVHQEDRTPGQVSQDESADWWPGGEAQRTGRRPDADRRGPATTSSRSSPAWTAWYATRRATSAAWSCTIRPLEPSPNAP